MPVLEPVSKIKASLGCGTQEAYALFKKCRGQNDLDMIYQRIIPFKAEIIAGPKIDPYSLIVAGEELRLQAGDEQLTQQEEDEAASYTVNLANYYADGFPKYHPQERKKSSRQYCPQERTESSHQKKQLKPARSKANLVKRCEYKEHCGIECALENFDNPEYPNGNYRDWCFKRFYLEHLPRSDAHDDKMPLALELGLSVGIPVGLLAMGTAVFWAEPLRELIYNLFK